jgi:Superinfection immunity protein
MPLPSWRRARDAACVHTIDDETGENGFMQNIANSYAFWIFVFVALAVVYMMPTLIGMIRGVDRLALVFLVNLIGAPTGVGWFAAMILAFGPRRHPLGPPLPVRPATSARLWVPGGQDAR